MLPQRANSDRFARLRATLTLGGSHLPTRGFSRPLTLLLGIASFLALWFIALSTLVFSDTPAERWRNFLLFGSIALALIGVTALVYRAEASRPLLPAPPEWMIRFAATAGVIVMVLALGLLLYAAVTVAAGVGRGVWVQLTWSAPAEPYSARVTGSVVRTAGRSTTRSPVVDIAFTNGRRVSFVSHQASGVRFETGEIVTVLRRSTADGEAFEVNSTFHLWLEQGLIWLLLFVVPVVSMRFLPRRH